MLSYKKIYGLCLAIFAGVVFGGAPSFCADFVVTRVENADFDVIRGTNTSGGGGYIKDEFIAWATSVLETEPGIPCGHRARLKNTLATVPFKFVDDLYDFKRGDFVTDKNTVAWGSADPYLIQIKNKSDARPDHWTLERMLELRHSIAHQVIHELYRAAGIADPNTGLSVDENYQITVRDLKLNQWNEPMVGAAESFFITDPTLVDSIVKHVGWRSSEKKLNEIFYFDRSERRPHYKPKAVETIYTLDTYTAGGKKFGLSKLICRVTRTHNKAVLPGAHCIISGNRGFARRHTIAIEEVIGGGKEDSHSCSAFDMENSLWGRLANIPPHADSFPVRFSFPRVEGKIDNGVLYIDLRLSDSSGK